MNFAERNFQLESTDSKSASSASTDQELIERIKQQDTLALSLAYDRYAKLLYSIALQILQDQNEAQEVLQEAFLTLWQKTSLFQEQKGSLQSWLCTIIRRRSIDLWRAKKAQKKGMDSFKQDLAEPVASSTPYDHTFEHELQAAVQKALAELPASQRLAIEVAYFKGLSHSEIAEHLNMPLGTVKTQIATGMARLRTLLKKYL